MSTEVKFLIGVDGSQDGDEAFNFYAQHYHAPEQQALLVYVVKPLVISSNEMALYVGEIRAKSLSEEKIKVKHLKDTYEEKMRTYGIRGKINIIYYSKKPGKIICELAEQEECCVIVIGCRRSGKGSLGPTADYVLRKATCAVSLARVPEPISELSGSFCRLEEFRVAKTSRDTSPRTRRISCPVVCSPPLVPEASGAVGGMAVGIGQGCNATGGFLSVAGATDVQKPQKQRRHSSVVNAFQHFTLHSSGRKRLIPPTDEGDETKG